ncbi:hypothetical protein D1007_46268 [Hordeum vulgare]|nr:hypothetical protein D1007_46268 [Hordeum vulgare]
MLETSQHTADPSHASRRGPTIRNRATPRRPPARSRLHSPAQSTACTAPPSASISAAAALIRPNLVRKRPSPPPTCHRSLAALAPCAGGGSRRPCYARAQGAGGVRTAVQKIKSLPARTFVDLPDLVRVVSIGSKVEDLLANPESKEWLSISTELCGAFALISKEGIAKGVRRITDVTVECASQAMKLASSIDSDINEASKLDGATLEKKIGSIKNTLDAAAIPAARKADLKGNVSKLEASKSVSGASVDANGKLVVKVEKRDVDFVDYISVNYVLVATGSSQQGYSFAAQHGHSIIPAVPSLFTFKIADKRLADLSGVTFTRVKAKLMLDGIQKSAPELTQKSKVNSSFPKEFGLVKRFWGFLLEQESIDGDMHWATVPKNHLNATTLRLKQWMFEVVRKGHFKDEFVTARGVPLSEITLSTMESKKQPNLFFIGEVLNVDGSPADSTFR